MSTFNFVTYIIVGLVRLSLEIVFRTPRDKGIL